MAGNALTAMPRFSIVIPTRGRPATLAHTLRTCLSQSFGDVEFIVFDNSSPPATEAVARGFGDRRVTFVRSDAPLAMSDSWEAALGHARGEYVLVLGDDDGLLPHALEDLDRLLRATGAKALRWERVYYSWPDIPMALWANKLAIPLAHEHRVFEAADILPAIANGRADYTLLPMLYNAAIHRDLIAALRVKAGRVFGAQSPDIYSGFAFAWLAGRYLSLGHPLAVNAGSATSNGIASIGLEGASPVAAEFQALNRQAGFAVHPMIPRVIVLPAGIADAFLHAKDRLFPDDRNLVLDRRRLARLCLEALRAQSGNGFEEGVRRIRESFADDPRLRNWFEREVARRPRAAAAPAPWSRGFSGDTLHLDASEFGIADVFGVAALCGRILGRAPVAIEWRKRGRRDGWRRIRAAVRMLRTGR